MSQQLSRRELIGGLGMMNQGVSNGGLIVGDDHVMAIDSLGAPLQSKAFLAAIQKTAPSKPIRQVLITHHHGDHIWGLPFFPPTEILSHPYCREAMWRRRSRVRLVERYVAGKQDPLLRQVTMTSPQVCAGPLKTSSY